MSSITVDVISNKFVLTGDVESIRSNRHARSNFKSCGASFEEEDKIVLQFSTEDKVSDYPNGETQFEAIKRLLKKFNINYEITERTSDLLKNYIEENEAFKHYSENARNIRDGHLNTTDFQRFTDILNKTIIRKLLPRQLLSAYHLAFSQNACNFSVPGAGKTSIVYGAYAYMKEMGKVDRILIISPLSAFAPWKDEYELCFGFEPSVEELVGVSPQDRQNHFYSGIRTEITLISYQTASKENDIENIKAYLSKNKVMVVLDEAHRIKNVEGGQWANAILSIANYATSRVVLTGTPAPNGYQDLYNLYEFIWPNKKIITLPVRNLQQLSKNYSPSSRKTVQKLVNDIAPFFIRIKKRDLHLPIPIENEPIIVPMSKLQQQIYNLIEQKQIKNAELYLKKNSLQAYLNKNKLVRLMQCATNLHLLKEPLIPFETNNSHNSLEIDDSDILDSIKTYDPQLDVPPKFSVVLELLQAITRYEGPIGKVVVWAIFVQNIIDLQDFLTTNDINCEMLYGDTPTEKSYSSTDPITREEIIREFHSDNSDFKVIIANPLAFGESISLHQACHNAIFLEKNFNAAMYMQAKDRIHRCGLFNEDEISYYYLLSSDSIDSAIHERVLEKEERMLEAIEHEDIPLLSMDMEGGGDINVSDVKAIINDYYARRRPNV